jgi:Protein of unknown function (DUF2793)
MTYPLYDLRTARHDLPLLFAGQSQKEIYVNELAARVDALLHLAIESETATPPATVVDGQSWLVGTGATGAWAGQDSKIAARAAGNWLFLQPTAGMILLNKATGQQVRYQTGWQAPSKPALPAGGTTIDAEARTAIAAIVAAMVSAGIVPAN